VAGGGLAALSQEQTVKSIFRFICFLLMISGWAVAALSVYVIRTPDPTDPQKSKLIVVPKNRLDFNDTYVDARTWTIADVPTHPIIIMRVLETDKQDEMKYLADPKSNKDIRTQLNDALTNSQQPAPTTNTSPTTAHAAVKRAGFFPW
jgi:hypothetical protein